MVVSKFEMQETHISQSGHQLEGKQHQTGDRGMERTAPSQEGDSSVFQSGTCLGASSAAQHRPITKSGTKTPNRWTLFAPPWKTPTGPAATAEPAGL